MRAPGSGPAIRMRCLALVLAAAIALAAGQPAHAGAEAGQCGPTLLLLPSSPDPNTDVLFNMQTRKVEEAVHLATVSGRTLVEPAYVFGARNWTWFEDAHHNQLSSNADIHQGVLGTIEEPLSSFFELAPLERLMQRAIPSLASHTAACGHHLDLIVRFYGHSGISTCDDSSLRVPAWGVTWVASRVVCVHAAQLANEQALVDMTLSASTLALEFLPPKFVEQRRPGWRASPERMRVREALVWATALVREAEEFIAARLDVVDNEDADVVAGGQGGGSESEAGVGKGELGQFIAVHWRRGDRAYQEEMGIHGHVDVALTGPVRMVQFVRDLVSSLESTSDDDGDDGLGGGVSGIFLATNCGNEEHLAFVEENLGAVRLPASGDWRRAAHEAVIEQIIMSRAKVAIVPPGVGDPPNVNDTSNFSLFVLEQRRINAQMRRAAAAARATGTDTQALSPTPTAHADLPYYMCCGTSPVLSIWRPRAGETVLRGGGMEGGGGLGAVAVHVWGAFVPAGRARVDVSIELESCPAPLRIGLGASGNGKVSIWVDGAAAGAEAMQISALVVTEVDGREEEEEQDRISVLLSGSSAESCVSRSQAPRASAPQSPPQGMCNVMVGVAADSFRALFHLGSLSWPMPAPVPPHPHTSLALAWNSLSLSDADAGGLVRGGAEDVGQCILACQLHTRCLAVLFVAAVGAETADDKDGVRCRLLLQASDVAVPADLWADIEVESPQAPHGGRGVGKEGLASASGIGDRQAIVAIKVNAGAPVGTRRWRQKRCLPLDYVCMYAS